MTKPIVWTRFTVHAFSAADKVGGRAPQGAKTGAAFVVGAALAARRNMLLRATIVGFSPFN